MQNLPIFYDSLWRENFPLEIAPLTKACLDYLQSDVSCGCSVSNLCGYQSWDEVHTREEFKQLVEIIQIQFKQLSSDLELIDQVDFEINNMWINVNFPCCQNKFHRHVNPPSLDRAASSSIISGTFYVKVPENSGDLVFHARREDYEQMIHVPTIVRIPEMFYKNYKNPRVHPLFRVKPLEGDLILWCADLLHSAEQNKSKDNRISINFNIGVKIK